MPCLLTKDAQWRALGLLCLIAIFVFLPIMTDASPNIMREADWSYLSGFNPHGPFIDRVVWIVYPVEDQTSALLALQMGQVQAYDEPIPTDAIPGLEATPGVEVTSELSYIYRHFTIDCHNFPTNITGYRRALAYALDKNAVTEVSSGGFGEPMDGAIPVSNSFWTYEHQMPYHYYMKDIVSANISLDTAHFIDTPDSPHPGWRYYDADHSGNWTLGDIESDECEIEIMCAASFDPLIQACLILVAGMEECGLKASIVQVDFASMSFQWPEKYWLAYITWSIPPPGDPTLLYYLFYSKGGWSLFYHYNNSAYDYNITQMMNAPTKLDARSWAWNCSQILLNDVPMITCYNDAFIHAYRTDTWEGYVNMMGMNRLSDNPWTLRNIRIKEELGGPWGLTFPVEYTLVLTGGMHTTNCLKDDSVFHNPHKIFSQIYSCLWQVDPKTWEKVPDLAYNWTIEKTTASGDIQDGQKMTFYLYENVSWHDGMPFTSEDVAFSLGFIWPHGYWRPRPYAIKPVENIYRIDTPDEYTVEIYTNQSGYFEFTRSSSPYILPKHIWESHYNYIDWKPETPQDLTGSGPFKWVYRVPGEYIVLERYDTYHFGVDAPERITLIPFIVLITGFIINLGFILIVILVLVLASFLKKRSLRKGAIRKGVN